MCFKFLKKGFSQIIAGPIFGSQDKGITPGGPMDAFSMNTGNLLLQQDRWSSALEFISPPELLILNDVFIVLTGAPYERIVIRNNDKTYEIEHATATLIKKGSKISFHNKKHGFRSYFCYKSAENSNGKNLISKRKKFDLISKWYSSDNSIRVVRGPEYYTLENPEAFFDCYWKIGLSTSQMGMRLESPKIRLKSNCKNMISEPVADGTVQLTQSGPIILLKHRQTIGGYPRIFNVISADVDLLGQYSPLQSIKFSEVSMTEALNIKEKKNNILKNTT